MIKEAFYVIGIFLVGCLIMSWGGIMKEVMSRHELMECQEWQKQSKIYRGYYITDWQKEQCLEYQILLEDNKPAWLPRPE